MHRNVADNTESTKHVEHYRLSQIRQDMSTKSAKKDMPAKSVKICQPSQSRYG